MADNFDKVVKALLENNKSQAETTDAVDKLNKTMSDHFTFLKRQMKDQEEDRAEAKKAKGEARAANPSTKSASKSLGLGNMGGIAGMLLPLTVGIAATASALAGLRGWEVSAIKKINSLVKLPLTLSNGLIQMRNATLGMFGLTAEGLLTRDAQGRFQRAAPITTQIGMRMNALRIRALKMFGLGADGKLLAVRGDDGLFKKNIIGRVTFQVGRILKPLVQVSEGVAKFATSKAGAFLKTLTTFGGNFAKLFAKILWPIGFLMSLFDGVKAYQESDADGLIGKLGDGVGGFLGSLIGAPFDLLKKGITWVIKKLFGVETDADGKVKEGQGMAGWIVKQLESFSFEETIKKITSGIFGVVEGAIEWVKLLFSDPKEALTNLFSGLLKTIGFAGKTFLDILWFPINTVVDFALEAFGWKEDDAPKFNLRETITGWVTDFFEWFTGFLPNISKVASDLTATITNLLPEWLKKSLGLVPPDADADAIARAAQEQKLISNILTADTNADGILTKKEFYASEGQQALSSALKALDMLRGNELSTMDEILKGSRFDVIINNIDQSQTKMETAKAKTPMLSEGMGATDSRYDKKYMGMMGFGVAPGQGF
jgi:hypothetical protein